MLKRKYVLVGLSTMTILNLLSFHTRTTQAEELLSAYSSTEDSTMYSTSSEKKPIVDSSTTTDSSIKESETEASTQDSTTDTSTVQETTDKTKTSEQTTKESKDAAQNSRATNFNLSDWQFTETADTITLNKYIGTSNDITIPAEFNNQQVIINAINELQFPQTLTNVTFQSLNNKKVLVNSNNMFIAFQGYSSLQHVDFSGLDMGNIVNMGYVFNLCSNLESVNFGNNTLSNLTTMSHIFDGCGKLKFIDISQLKMNNVTTLASSFAGCSSLETLDFGTNTLPKVKDFSNTFLLCTNIKTINGRFTLDSVTNMYQSFSNCFALQQLDTSQWNTSKVTNMESMFLNCNNLQNIDVSHWDVSQVTNFFNMFNSCLSIHELDMTNWHLQSNADIGGIFYSVKHSPLFILTNDERLLNYDYVDAWRDPYGPKLNGNGGTFNNKASSLNFLGSPAIRPSDPRIQNSTFKNELTQFMNDNIPTRTDYAFTQWNVSGTPVENAQTIKDLFSTTYTAQWVSSKYSTSVDNTILTTSTNLDFAYIPTRFTTEATPIKNAGNQEIPLLKTETFNIGVKDRTRTNQSWSVTAQLTWDNPQLKDAYIQTYNPGGATNQNISTGSSPYDPTKDLVVNQDGVNGMSEVKISTSAPIPIMESNSQINKNAVYDYGLGEAKLVIPETQNIQVGSYTGNVEWNLVSAP
ncbi:BspA family leucine-rich repeat surface protein [Enterococcus hirae]|uniref:BspA family leucine-rich repeat surface protein n=1 Tax=Enterococcus hirae TaxID=1354 RepID=UPI00255AAC6B|nr:BspA family leucine-rich repeat surface protein [Enterococcus hirae]MDL4889565.1 BspA family leucine-rich repeat surface protein [Enterococcus hirae]MDL4892159.1 BspA family leucine-rich repeat surface protein [Enterococcus hirae]MDL4898301.1 BspA family leucine-rich repeat surface protein [Enterococcus hirae]MDL4900911.1 BspA family leucine-rich repeat surface protein [Enterococcus hirae]MDL4903517.1 BspA family leucine-rich repeat surface protein [Enterococcus hirae]